MARPTVPYNPELAEAILAELQAGVKLCELKRLGAVPTWHVLKRWRAQVPKFDYYFRLYSHRKLPVGDTPSELLFQLDVDRALKARGFAYRRWDEVEEQMRLGMGRGERLIDVDGLAEAGARFDPEDPESAF